jgi:hypothetical protein
MDREIVTATSTSGNSRTQCGAQLLDPDKSVPTFFYVNKEEPNVETPIEFLV